MVNWVNAKVKEIKNWTNTLFSLRLEAEINDFNAGQFAKIAQEINGKRIQRAYSYVNAPKDSLLEFYIAKIPEGKMSPYLHSLHAGDVVQISKNGFGFFVLSKIPDCNTLWMLATGTAIGPYLSILQQGDDLNRFNNIVLVHAVRYNTELSFLLLMKNLQQNYLGKLHIQTIVSREYSDYSLHGRIPQLIRNGKLERNIGLSIDPENSHVMLCGNPQMVYDTHLLLKETRYMNQHLEHKPGHISSERYW
ncbi:ferredoxin--NADP(+) reductase [Pantoea sp. Aalb]|uniref:ferredoxin--NADP(+) reductase n=1 Tax=Pantoea sp. Aalb TaxID=2576762 RepID=UPI00132060C9|nr:ferredoxin--NADP(+) reductase [Pantoea sp. Aalb]MXP67928.1 ferredoxin--NADP(+) reductase [Pantoea sp. Aalb]